MGIRVYSPLWVMQELCHQPYVVKGSHEADESILQSSLGTWELHAQPLLHIWISMCMYVSLHILESVDNCLYIYIYI